jgi:hypothetical protein
MIDSLSKLIILIMLIMIWKLRTFCCCIPISELCPGTATIQAEFTGSLRAGEADAKLQALLKGQMKFSVLLPGSFQ